MNTLSSTIRYVAKVLQSCKTEEQLDSSMNWAVAVIANKAKEGDGLIKADPRGDPFTHNVPPRVTACKICGGTGLIEEASCYQCKGSGRVMVSSDVTTFVKAYDPNKTTTR